MRNRYYVVDDFYHQPENLVDVITNTGTEEKSSGNYAGLMSELSFFSTDHKNIFNSVVGHPVKPGTQLNGKFRFTKEDDIFKQWIHFDYGDNLAWSGVIYLSKDHPKDIDGTSFWRHKDTGLEEIPLTIEGIQKYGWNGVDDLISFLSTDGIDESKWEKIMTIPYKFNRLVLFRPWVFHAPGPGFGKTKDTSRIIQTFFLSEDT